jgi:hypothetical protein
MLHYNMEFRSFSNLLHWKSPYKLFHSTRYQDSENKNNYEGNWAKDFLYFTEGWYILGNHIKIMKIEWGHGVEI